jgi:hypothetical protein
MALKLVRYLAATATCGLTYGSGGAYCYADYAGDIDSRRSMTGYVLPPGGAFPPRAGDPQKDTKTDNMVPRTSAS